MTMNSNLLLKLKLKLKVDLHLLIVVVWFLVEFVQWFYLKMQRDNQLLVEFVELAVF